MAQHRARFFCQFFIEPESVGSVSSADEYNTDLQIRVAEAASVSHAAAAIDIYSDLAELWIGYRERKHYRRGGEFLARVQDLYRKTGREQDWADRIADVKDRHARLRTL